jgi:hypothetical protein
MLLCVEGMVHVSGLMLLCDQNDLPMFLCVMGNDLPMFVCDQNILMFLCDQNDFPMFLCVVGLTYTYIPVRGGHAYLYSCLQWE